MYQHSWQGIKGARHKDVKIQKSKILCSYYLSKTSFLKKEHLLIEVVSHNRKETACYDPLFIMKQYVRLALPSASTLYKLRFGATFKI